MVMGDRILSPRIIHTKVTIEPHFVLKSGIKGSQKFLGVRVMDVDCMLFKNKNLHVLEYCVLVMPKTSKSLIKTPSRYLAISFMNLTFLILLVT